MTVVEEMDESIQDDEFMADTASVEDMDIAPPQSMSNTTEHDQGGPNDHHNNTLFNPSLANNNNNHLTAPIQTENDWFFSQVKGSADPQVTDADIISTVEFNDTGELLATGDKGGRIVIFHRSPDVEAKYGEYQVYSTFQSHEPEFDYLKSLEIEEKINKIKWLPQHNSSHYLLSTNDKTIKLWKIQKKNRKTTGYNLKDEDGNPKHFTNNLIVPRYEPTELMIEASPRRVFSNAHTYHINSISLNTDLETFLSADDLRINLWNLSITDQSFNIVDIKPANMEELSEVITAAEFHPKHCNIFAYSSSRGNVKLCDMRQQALCDSYYKLFEQQEDDSERSQNFFSEICSSLSDVRFSHSGRYMLTRDYLTVKVWDLNMESGPVACYQVHPSLRHKLCWLYENDSIFDKFECSWSHDDRHIITGSYQNRFRIFNLDSQAEYTFEASRELYPTAMGRQLLTPLDDIESGRFDTVKKQIHSAWHPQHDVIALAASDNLYLFTGLEREIPDMSVPREHSREHNNTTIHDALDTSNISNTTHVSMNSTLSEHKPDSSSINSSHTSEHRNSDGSNSGGGSYGNNNSVLFRGLTTTPNSQQDASSNSQHSNSTGFHEDGSGDHHNL